METIHQKFQTSYETKIIHVPLNLTLLPDIVLCAGSDKSIEAIDMNAGKTSVRLPDVQNRAVHAIAQNQVWNVLLMDVTLFLYDYCAHVWESVIRRVSFHLNTFRKCLKSCVNRYFTANHFGHNL